VRERRSEPRDSVSWPVRVWLGEGVFVVARAIDASAGGLRLTLSPRSKPMIQVDRSYAVELELVPAPITCVATVRHADGQVGLAFAEHHPALGVGASRPKARSTGT
jgi:PilZ domain-containing protein